MEGLEDLDLFYVDVEPVRELTPEENLWLHVIKYGISEALNNPHRKWRERAKDWIYSKEFEQVCAFVAIRPEMVRIRLEREKGMIEPLQMQFF